MSPENSVTFMNVFETERELEIGVMGAEASVRNECVGQDLAPNGEYSEKVHRHYYKNMNPLCIL